MHGNKQEQEEYDNVRQPEGKVYNTSDIKNEKSDKRQEQVQKDMPNAQFLQQDRQHSNTQYNQRRKQLKNALVGLIAGLLQTTAD